MSLPSAKAKTPQLDSINILALWPDGRTKFFGLPKNQHSQGTWSFRAQLFYRADIATRQQVS